MKTVQYSSQRRGTPNLHLLSHPLTLRRCNLSNESNCIVCRDAPLEFLNLPWCPSPVTGIAVVPSLTQTFPRQELQCPMTNEIRPLHHRCLNLLSCFLGTLGYIRMQKHFKIACVSWKRNLHRITTTLKKCLSYACSSNRQRYVRSCGNIENDCHNTNRNPIMLLEVHCQSLLLLGFIIQEIQVSLK